MAANTGSTGTAKAEVQVGTVAFGNAKPLAPDRNRIVEFNCSSSYCYCLIITTSQRMDVAGVCDDRNGIRVKLSGPTGFIEPFFESTVVREKQ